MAWPELRRLGFSHAWGERRQEPAVAELGRVDGLAPRAQPPNRGSSQRRKASAGVGSDVGHRPSCGPEAHPLPGRPSLGRSHWWRVPSDRSPARCIPDGGRRQRVAHLVVGPRLGDDAADGPVGQHERTAAVPLVDLGAKLEDRARHLVLAVDVASLAGTRRSRRPAGC